jgi:hypothetical protein
LACFAEVRSVRYRVMLAQSEAGTARGELADYRLQVAERDRHNAAKSEPKNSAARPWRTRRVSVHDNNWNWPKVAPLLLSLLLAGCAGKSTDCAGRAATCDTIAAQRRQAGTSAVVVLGGLLQESDRMAGDLATALERSRIAGLACEATYDHMKNESSGWVLRRNFVLEYLKCMCWLMCLPFQFIEDAVMKVFPLMLMCTLVVAGSNSFACDQLMKKLFCT